MQEEPKLFASDGRFWSKVQPAPALECWLWTASTLSGYGGFYLKGKLRYAHRVAYEMLRSEIPDGLYVDHLCRTPLCVNPWHLEPVSPGENTKRGDVYKNKLARTHCKRGHPFAGSNLAYKEGRRRCVSCRRLVHRVAWTRNRAGA